MELPIMEKADSFTQFFINESVQTAETGTLVSDLMEHEAQETMQPTLPMI